MLHGESAAEILVFSAEDEAILLLICSTEVQVKERGLEPSHGFCLFSLEVLFAF